ncbi:MAG: DUF951 domain-containing protein [Clostridiales bacterium]|nr:DUF951 domain-containing protein [Clostridiales bacterium]
MGEIELGDVVRTRKKHPCGQDTWTVIRVGADIKIRCHGCGRIVMLDRESYLRRVKTVLSRGGSGAASETLKEGNHDADPA